jgi:hypothetical protein
MCTRGNNVEPVRHAEGLTGTTTIFSTWANSGDSKFVVAYEPVFAPDDTCPAKEAPKVRL